MSLATQPEDLKSRFTSKPASTFVLRTSAGGGCQVEDLLFGFGDFRDLVLDMRSRTCCTNSPSAKFINTWRGDSPLPRGDVEREDNPIAGDRGDGADHLHHVCLKPHLSSLGEPLYQTNGGNRWSRGSRDGRTSGREGTQGGREQEVRQDHRAVSG